MSELISKCQNALTTVDKYFNAAVEQVRKLVIVNGKLSKEILAEKQHASHGLAWIATYRAALKEMINWAIHLEDKNSFQEIEQSILQFTFSEYCSQVKSGIPMSQLEFIRPQDLGFKNGLFNEIRNDDFDDLILNGNSSEDRVKLAHLLRDGFSSKNFGIWELMQLQCSSVNNLENLLKRMSYRKLMNGI